jgi:acetone carboxylase gamma subunit
MHTGCIVEKNMIDLHEKMERFRDYFLLRSEAEKVEQVNSILTDLDDNFFICKEEVEALYHFFMTCGYIDYEKHERVHKIVDRLIKFREAHFVVKN